MEETRPHRCISLVVVCVFVGCAITISIVRGQDVSRAGARSGTNPDTFSIFGTVRDATPDTSEAAFARLIASKTDEEFFQTFMEMMADRPAPKAVVNVRGTSVTRTAVTDAQGKFVFAGLSRGVYDVSAELPPRRSGTGGKQVAAARKKVNLNGDWQEDLELHADLVIVKGRVTDTHGRPVARAKVTGTEYPWSQVGIPYSVTVLSNDDGSYELGGFVPSHLFHLVGYLNGGNPSAGDTPFFVDIVVEADAFVKGHARTPAVTETLLASARRLLKVMHQAAVQFGGKSDLQEKEGLDLPTSHGNTITGINIAMEKMRDPKPETP